MFPASILERLLHSRQEQRLYRRLESLRPQGPWVLNEGRQLLNFASNDYLSLAHHPALAQAASTALQEYGSGSTGSRLLTGSLDYFQRAEQEMADWKGSEAALFFATGYSANLALVSALGQCGSQLFFDRLNHASLYDGAKLAGIHPHRFAHNDPEDLRKLVRKHPGPGWIFCESVYSMDGDFAPLAALVEIATEHGLGLVVDEAHAEGIFGPEGRGLVHALGLQNQVDVVMGTFGKALGCAGACVWTSQLLRDTLVNLARPFIFSTAPSPGLVGAALRSLRLPGEEPWRAPKVLALAQTLRTGLCALGLDPMHSQSQIVPILLGENARALDASAYLREQGFWVTAIRPPTVPPQGARLRVNLCANHEEEHVQRLLSALQRWQKKGP